MRITRLTIKKFRGIRTAVVLLPRHGVLIGDNNTGKTTILEAIDLVLVPDRLNRQPPVDEHDFFQGRYLPRTNDPAAKVSADGEAEDGAGHGPTPGSCVWRAGQA